MNPFRIHCSQIGKIMGRIGLTDKQLVTMNELHDRNVAGIKPLTAIMATELMSLRHIHNNPSLPETATTHLKEYYAGDREDISTRQTRKGDMMELDCIDFSARVLGYGIAKKNEQYFSDEYMIGTPDVIFHDSICDVKCSWNRKTFLDSIHKIDSDYEYQLRGYMRLLNKPKGILFFGLMNTPPELSWDDEEVSYDHLPDSERWIAYEVKRDATIEQQIIDRVVMCRAWLDQYHTTVQAKIGRVHVQS